MQAPRPIVMMTFARLPRAKVIEPMAGKQQPRERRSGSPSGPARPSSIAVPQDLVQKAAQSAQAAANQSGGLADPALHDQVRTQIQPSIDALEKSLGYPVITYFLADHEAMADSQVLHLYEHLRRIGKQGRIGLWISSRGGHTEVPWKIVSLFREFTDWWSILIPYRAHSSATLVALGADELVMTEMSELGPIDPTRTHPLLPRQEGTNGPVSISVQDLRHVLSFLKREIPSDQMTVEIAATIYTRLFEYVHPLAIGALEQSWALAEHVGRQVLATHLKPDSDGEKIRQIVERLSDGYKSHRYQISRREAKEIGLNVRDATVVEADAMWAIYRAYDQDIKIDGEAAVDGKSARLVRAGHMNSVGGNTLGVSVQMVGQAPMDAQWVSRWVSEPKVGSSQSTAPTLQGT